jgi:NADH-quinone oxidoreductase subunit M
VVARDLNRREVAVIAPLMVGLVLFGFYPMPLLDVSNPTVDALLQDVGVTDDEPVVPAAEHGSVEEGQQ